LSLFVLGVGLGLRSTGALQPLELRAYDILLSLVRFRAPGDQRITLIGVREADLVRYGWPLTDDVLADALTRLLAHQPRAVGLDLFRDHPQPPGNARLAALLRDDLRIVVVMKYPGGKNGGVAPPPAVEDPERIGFADMLIDPDGIVRRGLLFLGGDEEVYWSLALRLATAFLDPLGLVPESDERDPRFLRLGAATYVPLGGHDGGFVGADAMLELLARPRGFEPLTF
jgi:adenylate cyclase